MAQVTYIVRVKDQTGARVAEFVGRGRSIETPGGMGAFSYRKRVRTTGGYSLRISADDERIQYLDLDTAGTLDSQIEFWRRDPLGGAGYTAWLATLPAHRLDPTLPGWYKDFEAFHRDMQYLDLADGRTQFIARGQGYNVLLAAEPIRYDKGSVYASKSGVAETVLKEYVDENIGPSATAPPRDRSGVMPGLTIQADAAMGAAWEGDRGNKNLLDVAIELADIAPADYFIVGTGAITFEFQWGYPQWGLDKSIGNAGGLPPVIFSRENGNATNISYRFSRLNEINTVDVLGVGKAGDRVVETVTTGYETDSAWNRRAVTRDARREWDAAVLSDLGDKTLNERRIRRVFSFRTIQTPGCRYGRDWEVGDIVTLIYRGFQVSQKIVGVTVTLDNAGNESITPETEDVQT